MSEFYTVEDARLNEFYQLPKVLIHDDKYKGLTPNEKIAYAILRDRHSVSLKNEWIDERGRVYFIFTDKELSEILGTTIRTANKTKNKLCEYGLMQMKRQGLKKPNVLYLLKPKASSDADRKKTSYPDRKKTSCPDRKKTSCPIYSNTNKSNTNKSNNNLSINENDVTKLDVPIPVKKQLIEKIDRLIDDEILLNDIELVYKSNRDHVNDFQFAQILSNVLEHTKGRIVNIKNLMQTSIINHSKPKQEFNTNTRVDTLPKWMTEKDDFSNYDFTKNDILMMDKKIEETKKMLMKYQ